MKQTLNNYRLNLASRPFMDMTAAWVAFGLLIVLALAFTIFNAFLLFSASSGSADASGRIEELQTEMEAMRADIDEIDSKLRQSSPGQIRGEILYVNDLIARRTMSWSSLFSRLEEIAPAEMRMLRISPSTVRGDLQLAFTVEVPRQEVIRQFINSLETSQYFDRVELNREALDSKTGTSLWELTARYYEDGEGR